MGVGVGVCVRGVLLAHIGVDWHNSLAVSRPFDDVPPRPPRQPAGTDHTDPAPRPPHPFSQPWQYGPLVGQGLAYSIFAAALWPSVPYAVEEQYVGTAYGVMTAVQNTGLATFPLAVSALLTSCTNNPPKKLDQVLSQSDFTGCSNVSPPTPFPPD